MKPVALRLWSLTRARSPRSDRWRAYLCGENAAGLAIQTSAIVSIDGDLVRTSSGSLYRLTGPPSPMFLPYLEGSIDPRNPLATLVPRFTFEWKTEP